MKRKIVFILGCINAGLGAILIAINHQNISSLSWKHLILIVGVGVTGFAMKSDLLNDKKE